MKNMLLPFDKPIYFEGEYKKDPLYCLAIQMFSCTKVKLKEGKIPCLQIKHRMEFMQNEYIEEYNEGSRLCLCMTNIDLKLFLDQYEVENLRYICGWKFKAVKGLFDKYVDKWLKVKNEGTLFDNKAKRTIAKIMLNSLSGKFASAIERREKIPYIAPDGCVHYKLTDPKIKSGIYMPTSIFITSYGRDIIVRTAQKIRDYSLKKYGYDGWIYSDTDSCHTLLSIEDLKQIVEIDPLKLGAFKVQTQALKGKFIKQKCYIEQTEDEIKIKCSGMPKSCYSNVEWEDFKTGYSVKGKLRPKRVVGGIKLVETDFTIKDETLKNNIAKFRL